MKLSDLLQDNIKESIILIFDDRTLLESKLFNIPGTKQMARYDPGNTNTKTKDHFHVFAN